MKHAYLIMAHNNFHVLEYLLKSLDHPDNHIYLHIDKKATNIPTDQLVACLNDSPLEIYQELSVTWGQRTQIDCELFLLEKSTVHKYDYYHLLSGADMPIKPMSVILDFFQKNAGKEFVHFYNNEEELPYKIKRRVALYHLFQQRYSAKNPWAKKIYKMLNIGVLGIQWVLHVNRIKNVKQVFKYGANWFSITHSFATHVLQQKKWIEKTFQNTKCCDEIFLQTILYNSPFRDNLYYNGFDNNYEAIKRYIKFDPKTNMLHPFVWKVKDFDRLIQSDGLFSRKFDENTDMEITMKLYEYAQSN